MTLPSLSDRYAIEREAGRGGMATVYLARDLKHDRRVAIKVLNPELGAVLGVERFLSEIKVTANLQHPNLLPLFDSGETGGLLYYVMPFVDGETLRARLDREQQLPVDEALRIISAVANGLQYAHELGVIHRDLKPENILLQAGQPVIADFGIALAVSNAGGARVTQTGLSLGTPQYMSPEQATGDRVIDARSDQFSLAAVLYEMLTGEPPHTGGNAQVIIARLMTETPRPVINTRPSVPQSVNDAIARALMKAPADRFESVAAFARALAAQPVQGATTPGAFADATAPRSGAPAWRTPVIAAATIAAVAGIGWFATHRPVVVLDSATVMVAATQTGADASMTAAAARIDDALTQSVASLPWVKLRPAPAGASTDEPAIAAARKAGAATVVTASLLAGGDSAQLRLRLIDTETGTVLRQLPAAAVPRNPSADNARRAVEPLASAIGFVTDPMLGAVTLPSGPLPSLEAFREFEAGLVAFSAGSDTTSVQRSFRSLRKAIALDTSFTQAKLWLALSYAWRNYFSRYEGGAARADTARRWIEAAQRNASPYEAALAALATSQMSELAETSVESSQRLLALAPRSPIAIALPFSLLDLNRPREAISRFEALISPRNSRDSLPADRRAELLATVSETRHVIGEYDKALADIRAARALRRSDLLYLGSELQTLAALGRLDEMNRLLPEVATAAGNGNMFGFAGQVYVALGSELTAHGHPAEGRAMQERAVAWFDQHDGEAKSSANQATRRGLALMALGRYDEALPILRARLPIDTSDSRLHGLVGRIYAIQGRKAELQTELAWLEARPAEKLVGAPTYERAAITANLGREHWDQAVALLQESLKQGQGNGIRRRLHWFTDWQAMKDYPPFKALLEPKG